MNKTIVVQVRVSPTVPPSMLTDADKAEVPAWVDVRIDNDVPATQWADVALDVFHASFAVQVLDDFDFSVYAGDSLLDPQADHDSYSLERKGTVADVSPLMVAEEYESRENRSSSQPGPSVH